jgi:riboflavin synthase
MISGFSRDRGVVKDVFSGIVKGRGRIQESVEQGGDRRLVVGTAGIDLGSVGVGDSIAVNGVCLTALEPTTDAFAADVSAETLARTTLAFLQPGDAVNLEGSLRLGETLDGHFVYGHVDGIGRIAEQAARARSLELTIELPAELCRYVAVKGSIAIDGVSLTVNAVSGNRFSVNIIPHTRENTVISGYAPGGPVNIEVDMIARYLERLQTAGGGGISRGMLRRHGFIEAD